MKRSEKILTFCTILIMLLTLLFASAYAYLGYESKQQNKNNFKASCYDITYDEKVDGVTLYNNYPISDEAGLAQEPYSLTLTNNCEYSLNYNLYLNVMNESTTDNSLLRIGINGIAADLTNFTRADANVEDARIAYNLKTGSIKSKESITLNINSWMAPTVTTGFGENSQFVNKISVEITKPVE